MPAGLAPGLTRPSGIGRWVQQALHEPHRRTLSKGGPCTTSAGDGQGGPEPSGSSPRQWPSDRRAETTGRIGVDGIAPSPCSTAIRVDRTLSRSTPQDRRLQSRTAPRCHRPRRYRRPFGQNRVGRHHWIRPGNPVGRQNRRVQTKSIVRKNRSIWQSPTMHPLWGLPRRVWRRATGRSSDGLLGRQDSGPPRVSGGRVGSPSRIRAD